MDRSQMCPLRVTMLFLLLSVMEKMRDVYSLSLLSCVMKISVGIPGQTFALFLGLKCNSVAH